MSQPSEGVSWWVDQPRVGWSRRCRNVFDVSLNRKTGTGITVTHHTAEAALKLARFRSKSAALAKAGIRRHGNFLERSTAL